VLQRVSAGRTEFLHAPGDHMPVVTLLISLLFVALLAFLLQSIPIASLAAVLVYTGYKLVNIDGLKKLRKYGWGEVLIYMSTVTVVVAVDLLAGVLTGMEWARSHRPDCEYTVNTFARRGLPIFGPTPRFQWPMIA
jgi:hypothetical protein